MCGFDSRWALHLTRHGVWESLANPPASGAGDRRFKSGHPDLNLKGLTANGKMPEAEENRVNGRVAEIFLAVDCTCVQNDSVKNHAYRLRSLAHGAVAKALAFGKLIRQPCEVCGEVGQAHHDNYYLEHC